MLEWFAPGRHDGAAAAFADRDGVLNEHIAGGYVLTRAAFRWLPGARDGMRRLTESGRRLFVITNQSCIGQGFLDELDFVAIMADMVAALAADGVACDGWVCCPHRADAGCRCRKPEAAMLERVAEATGIDLAASTLVGDSESDIEAAHRAGARAILVGRNEPASLARAIDLIVAGAA